MSNTNLDDLRDFAVYGFKAYQDILFNAFNEKDAVTLHSVLNEFMQTFNRFLQRPELVTAKVLRQRIARPAPNDDIGALQARLSPIEKREDVARRLKLARSQVIFGLAGRGLDILFNRPAERQELLPLVNELIGHLPDRLTTLTEVFETANDDKVSQFWGWNWWDFEADGQAHWVDSHTRPNRLYCVRALQLLPHVDAAAIQNLRLAPSEDLIWLFEENNAQGIPATLGQLRQQEPQLEGILTAQQFARIDDFLAILRRTKAAQEANREDRLAAAPLVPAKVAEFKRNVVQAFNEVGKLRPLMHRLGRYRDLTRARPPKGLQSWGYNQLVDKGAFIADWHVSYSNWGETYGRGLAQAEDQTVFTTMVGAAPDGGEIPLEELIPALWSRLRAANIRNPIVFKTAQTMLEYRDIQQKDLFIPGYYQNCPPTPVSNLDGFAGVFKFPDAIVPVFNVFVQDPAYRNKIVAANLAGFIQWEQFTPTDAAEDDAADIIEAILVRVIDLNLNVERRRRLLAENPQWLNEKPDKEKFLRTHVIVNVYQRFKLEVLDSTAAIRLSIRPSAGDADG